MTKKSKGEEVKTNKQTNNQNFYKMFIWYSKEEISLEGGRYFFHLLSSLAVHLRSCFFLFLSFSSSHPPPSFTLQSSNTVSCLSFFHPFIKQNKTKNTYIF